MVTVLMPLPATDFDPTEVAVSWRALTAAGHRVVFATPSGQPGKADDLMVTGRGLDPWGAIPGARRLTVVGRVLRANADARRAYAELTEDAAFASPQHWGAARRSDYDALVLPGGHRARGMRPYLESPEVQQMAVDAFHAGKPVGAICHGVLVAARAVDPVTGHCTAGGRPR
jgi:putative intracellular protease/amidase